jgi:hypothetical protein
LLLLQESQLVNWNIGKLRGFCDGILAKEKSNVHLDIFKKTLRIAHEENLAQCSLEKNQDQDSCERLMSTDSTTLLTSSTEGDCMFA